MPSKSWFEKFALLIYLFHRYLKPHHSTILTQRCFVKLPKKRSPTFLPCNYLCFIGIHHTYYCRLYSASQVPSNYSWEFSGGFAHGLMNNYCQLPGGVHQFFFLSALAPFTDSCCWDFCLLPRSADLPCQWLWQWTICLDGVWRTGLCHGCAVVLPPLEARDTCSLYMYDALPYMGL